MHPADYSELPAATRQALKDLRTEAGDRALTMDASVPRGYVRDISTGTLYRLETWLAKVNAGLVKDANGKQADDIPSLG